MRTCAICHFDDIDLDDVAFPLAHDRCVCLRCFDRQSGDQRHVSKTLQREINSETPMTKIESDHETVAMERPM